MDSEKNTHEDASNTEEVLPGHKTIDDFVKCGFQAVMEATKFSNNLPSGHKWDIFCGYPSFQRIMNDEGRRILEIMNMVVNHQGVKGNIIARDMDEKFDLIVDVNDTVLERVGVNLDELSGIRRNPVPVVVESSGSATRVISGSWNRKANGIEKSKETPPIRLLTAKNIERPQIKFKDKIDNSSTPFVPRIKEKPNSLKPFSILLEIAELGECYSHPYEYELNLFKPSDALLEKVTPRKLLSVNDTPLKYIANPEDVPTLLSDLKKCSVIAVDLEHHSYRTFQGFTCLMQISTPNADYIVDTLTLRDKLEILNEVFTDPKVVKVFHGASFDIQWLQRDLCLYVVNMFDTHQAAKMLNFPHLSLAYLLKHYCNISVNKQFQLADWRIRPLPDELIKYAREDTHYLLYVYDMLRNDLVDSANGQTNLLASVIDQSTDICRKRYWKPIFTEESHMDLYRRNKKMFDNKQMYAFRELYRWRDKTARDEDESTGYVLPNHMLVNISEVLPREMQGILALCSPIPPLVRQNLIKLHNIILKAREQPLVRPILKEETRLRPIVQVVLNKLDLDSPLHCPHDMTHSKDFREDLPTLLTNDIPHLKLDVSANILYKTPHITVFESTADSEDEDASAFIKPTKSYFVSPYERYKRARPFLESQEAAEAENEDVVDDKSQIQLVREIERVQEIPKEYVIPLNQLGGYKRKRESEPPDTSSSEPATPRPKKKHAKIEEAPSPSTSKEENKEKQQTRKRKHQELTIKDTSPKKNKQVKEEKQDKKKKDGQTFDYNNVDYRNFQGGSAVPKSEKKNQANWKGKNKKSKFIGKTNHKSFTYGRNRK